MSRFTLALGLLAICWSPALATFERVELFAFQRTFEESQEITDSILGTTATLDPCTISFSPTQTFLADVATWDIDPFEIELLKLQHHAALVSWVKRVDLVLYNGFRHDSSIAHASNLGGVFANHAVFSS